MEIESFATLKDVPIFKAGTHNGKEYSESDVIEIMNSGNEASEYILESIVSGVYPGNEISLSKPVPGLLNFAHQKWLAATLKKLTKDVKVSWGKAGEWLTATLENVPDEVAEFLAARFPFRSIELIPELDIGGGRVLRNVPRSIGFLPPDISPAVKGQSPDFVMEFQEEQFTTLYSRLEEDEPPIMEEVKMEDKTQDVLQGVSVEEFEAYKEGQNKLIQSFSKANEELKTELDEWKGKATQAEQKADEQEIIQFCESLASRRVQTKEGEAIVSQALVDAVRPVLSHADNSQIIEFSEGNETSERKAIQGLVQAVIEMASKGSLLCPIGQIHKDDHKPGEEVDEFAGKNRNEIRELACQSHLEEANGDRAEAWRLAMNDEKFLDYFQPEM